MMFLGILRFNLVKLIFYFLTINLSQCNINVSVDSIEAHSAHMRWNITSPDNVNISGFKILIQTVGVGKPMEKVVGADASSYNLTDLDDMRNYKACVVTLVLPGGTSQHACALFTTPTGTGTHLAIVSGVFLFVCLIVFSVLDFSMSRRRKEDMDNKQAEMLEQGWQSFERNSKKKKGKKRQAPRPNSGVDVESTTAQTPLNNTVEETQT